MRCLSCMRWCLDVLCERCLGSIPLFPSLRWVDEMRVYSFYALSDVEPLLQSKYSLIGSRVLALLARKASVYFAQEMQQLPSSVLGVGIDDVARRGYSHTGVLVRAFKRVGICPAYGGLKATNPISYAGKSLAFRLSHPRGFVSRLRGQDIVLIDDVITTGTSLREAKNLLLSQDNRIFFALSLCDARN